MSARSPSLSVVVPTFERRASLARLLAALATQAPAGVEFEVVVVDDGSTDDTRAWLDAARTDYPLRVIGQANRGPASARNSGVAAASGDVIVFFDDDVVPAPDVLSVHAAAHSGSLDRVVVGPMLPPLRWERPSWIRWEEQQLSAQYEAMTRGLYPCTWRQFFTGNASLRRAAFMAASGFDAAFARAEDIELGYRLAAQGMQFVFEPAARVWHYPTRSLAAWIRTPYRYGRADVAMHRDKGNESLDIAYKEFGRRHPLSRGLVRLCSSSATRSSLATVALSAVVRMADATRAQQIASLSLSALFQVQYWRGVRDELGSRTKRWASPRPTRTA